MAIRPFKTNRNLAQYAAKKVLGKAHTRGDISDLQESLPSNVQLSASTIFADSIPEGPDNPPTDSLWLSSGNVQYVSLEAIEIAGTRYDADSSADFGGEDSNQNTGPHAWYLKLPYDYESRSDGSISGIGESPLLNDQKLYETLGKLQVVPTNFYINPSNPAINPYAPKIYTWDGTNESSKVSVPLTPNDSLDWFFDPYSGIVFFQEFDGRVPYKVECYLYTGKFVDESSSGSTTGIPGEVSSIRQYWKIITEYVAEKTDILIPEMNLDGVVWEEENISAYLNGQLLRPGTLSEVMNDDADYVIISSGIYTNIRFSDHVEIDDVVTITFLETSGVSESDILLWQSSANSGDLNNARVINAGTGISFDSTVPGQFTINSLGASSETELSLFNRVDLELISAVSVGSSVTFAGIVLDHDKPGEAQFQVYLNGQLLREGTSSDLSSGNADYMYSTVDEDLFLEFSQHLEVEDVLSVLYLKLGAISLSSFLTWQDDGNLDNARVITAGDGISISTANPREFLISSTGISERVKKHETAQSNFSATSTSTKVYTVVNNIDFSAVNYEDSKIDIFINGILKIKGMQYELYDTDNSLGNKDFKLLNNESIVTGDVISIIIHI